MWSVDVRYRYNGETGGKSKQYNGDAQWNRRKSIVIRDGVWGEETGGEMRMQFRRTEKLDGWGNAMPRYH